MFDSLQPHEKALFSLGIAGLSMLMGLTLWLLVVATHSVCCYIHARCLAPSASTKALLKLLASPDGWKLGALHNSSLMDAMYQGDYLSSILITCTAQGLTINVGGDNKYQDMFKKAGFLDRRRLRKAVLHVFAHLHKKHFEAHLPRQVDTL